jgi:hypothetical protein
LRQLCACRRPPHVQSFLHLLVKVPSCYTHRVSKYCLTTPPPRTEEFCLLCTVLVIIYGNRVWGKL